MPIIGLTTDLIEARPAGLLAELVANIEARKVTRAEEAAAAAERERALHAQAVALCRAAGVTPDEFTCQWSASGDGRLLAFVLTPAGFVWRLGVDAAGTSQAGRQAPLVSLALADADGPLYRLYPQRAPQAPTEGITRPVARTTPIETANFEEAAAWLHRELTEPANFWSLAELDARARRRAVWSQRVRWTWYGCEPVEEDEDHAY